MAINGKDLYGKIFLDTVPNQAWWTTLHTYLQSQPKSHPKFCSNISNLRTVLDVTSKENRQKPLLTKIKTTYESLISLLHVACFFLPFYILEDESLITVWGSIISYNSFIKCKLTWDEGLVFKNWSWRWIWSSGGKFLQFLTYLLLM